MSKIHLYFLALLLFFSLPLVVCGKDAIEVRIDTGAFKDGIFPRGERVVLGATLKNRTKIPVKVCIVWKIETDEKQPIATHSDGTTLEPGGKATVSFGLNAEKPGFFLATVTCSWKGGRVSSSMQIGYAPLELRPPLTAEPDFQAFWDKSRAALDKVPPRFRMIPETGKSNAQHDVYDVHMHSLGNVRVRGWFEVPRKPGPHPVLMRVPGYGQNMRPIGRFKDMIVFSFNVRGHGNSQEDVKGRPGDYWIRGLDAKEGYYYQGAYMDCVRAIDFLYSRKEVDPKRIAVGGSSQGGGLSFATAALDQRVSLCVPDIPFLANWEKYFKTTNWPEMNKWIAAKESRTWKSTLKTLSYFDAMNLAPLIRCPVFMGVGLQDGICPPATNFAPYNYLKGPREYRVYPQAKHGVGPVHHRLAFEWIRRNFGLENSF